MYTKISGMSIKQIMNGDVLIFVMSKLRSLHKASSCDIMFSTQ